MAATIHQTWSRIRGTAADSPFDNLYCLGLGLQIALFRFAAILVRDYSSSLLFRFADILVCVYSVSLLFSFANIHSPRIYAA
jgi:hypothetical protein